MNITPNKSIFTKTMKNDAVKPVVQLSEHRNFQLYNKNKWSVKYLSNDVYNILVDYIVKKLTKRNGTSRWICNPFYA